MLPHNTLAGGDQLIVQRDFTELWLCGLYEAEPECRLLLRHPRPAALYGPKSDPQGRYVIACENIDPHAWLIPLDGGEPHTLGGFWYPPQAVALDPDGRLAAAGGWVMQQDTRRSLIRIWDLESGEERVLDPEHDFGITDLWFLSGDRLLSASEGGLRLWDLATSQCQVLSEREHLHGGKVDASDRFLVVSTADGVTLWDLQDHSERILPIDAEDLWSLAISPDARFVVAGKENGDVVYLPVDTDDPHFLLGHEGSVAFVQVTQDGKQIMSADGDGSVRLWDVPEGRPLHLLPHGELLEVLRAQTNMRIVTDVDAEEGYRVVYDRFPGWESTPSW